MNFDNYLFRCSSLGKLAAKPRNKTEILSETAKKYLQELFFEIYTGVETDLSELKFIRKGLECEQDSFALLSEIRQTFIKKNKQRFNDTFLTGEPDILFQIENEVEDTKTSWDKITFFNADVTTVYDWQLEGYCILTGATQKRLTYVLVNTPAHLIESEKKRLLKFYDGLSDEFAKECSKLEILHIHDIELFKKENPDFYFHTDISNWKYDVKIENRIKSFFVPRQSEANLKRMENVLIESRNYLNLLTKQFN